MSTTETGQGANVDSKIAHAYDEGIARAQVDPAAPPAQRADAQGQLNVSRPDAADLRAETADPAMTPATAESKLGPGEELRDREFPVPDEMTGPGSRRVAVDQGSINDEALRQGGAIGSVDGDVQRQSDVPSLIDQDAVAPDLAQEQR